MKYSLDQLTDYNYKELHSFLSLDTLPEYVKEAEVLTKTATEDLPDTAFADQYHRAFPIGSASDVYVSNAFFINKRAELKKLFGEGYINEVGIRLVKSAELFNIDEDIKRYNQGLDEKEAQDYSEKTLVSFDIAGNNYELFPYKTAEDIEFQANQFASNINNYPFNWRPVIASEFIKQAAELGVKELPDIIAKYGGYYFPNTIDFPEVLSRRMRKLSEDKQELYKPLIEKASCIASREEAFNICGEAYKIEKLAGVYEKPLLYREMGDLIDRTMTLNLDKIAELLDVIRVGDDCYSIPELQKVSKEIYQQAFETTVDLSKVAELEDLITTAPLSDMALFLELSGIKAIK